MRISVHRCMAVIIQIVFRKADPFRVLEQFLVILVATGVHHNNCYIK